MSVCAALLQTAPPSGSSNEGTEIFEASNVDNIDCLLGYQRSDPDLRIRQRLEASRQGMLQLDALRNKHQKLMEEMRVRLSRFTELTRMEAPAKRDGNTSGNSITMYATQINNSNGSNAASKIVESKVEEMRSDSPVSCCFSHRSSVSMDSGCASISSDPSVSSNSPTLYSVYGRYPNEDRSKTVDSGPSLEENQKIVATAIESTTAVRCRGPKRYLKNWQRPKSMCVTCPEESALLVDSHSFSQITPPPIHRKFTSVSRSESVQMRRPHMTESCFDVRSSLSNRQLLTPAQLFVNQTSSEQSKLTSIAPLKNLENSPPLIRLRNSQKTQPMFHASRVYVDRSPRNLRPRPKSMFNVLNTESENNELHCSSILMRQQRYVSSNEAPFFEARRTSFIEPPRATSNVSIYPSQNYFLESLESCQAEAVLRDRSRRRLIANKEWKESEEL